MRDLATFRRFLAVLASRHGQVLDKTDLAAPLGVSVPTITHWLGALEATAQILILEAAAGSLAGAGRSACCGELTDLLPGVPEPQHMQRVTDDGVAQLVSSDDDPPDLVGVELFETQPQARLLRQPVDRPPIGIKRKPPRP